MKLFFPNIELYKAWKNTLRKLVLVTDFHEEYRIHRLIGQAPFGTVPPPIFPLLKFLDFFGQEKFKQLDLRMQMLSKGGDFWLLGRVYPCGYLQWGGSAEKPPKTGEIHDQIPWDPWNWKGCVSGYGAHLIWKELSST